MARKPDPARRPELLAQILEYLLDKPLATLSLRTLASALGVSTGTLVYQFGTRAEMIKSIVQAISARQSEIQAHLAEHPGDLDAYFAGLEYSWKWTLQPRNRKLQRMEFEASMLETLDRETHTSIRTLYQTWLSDGVDSLVALGLSQEDAEIESRVLVNLIYGMQYDLVVNSDEQAATAAFERVAKRHRRQIVALMRKAGRPTPDD